MAEESSLYGLENDAQEERELFSEGGTYANNGWSLWKKLLLLFFTAVMAAGGTWFLYGWSVLRKNVGLWGCRGRNYNIRNGFAAYDARKSQGFASWKIWRNRCERAGKFLAGVL